MFNIVHHVRIHFDYFCIAYRDKLKSRIRYALRKAKATAFLLDFPRSLAVVILKSDGVENPRKEETTILYYVIW